MDLLDFIICIAVGSIIANVILILFSERLFSLLDDCVDKYKNMFEIICQYQRKN